MNKFVPTKSYTGSKFSKISFGAVVHGRDCSCALCIYIAVFFVASGSATIAGLIQNRMFS